jgi:hypothetical protein
MDKERAAQECEKVAKEFDKKVLETPTGIDRNELTSAALAARLCAEKIRALRAS